MSSEIVAHDASVHIKFPSAISVLDYDMEIVNYFPTAPATIEVRVYIEIPNVQLQMPNGGTLTIPRFLLRSLSGEMLPQQDPTSRDITLFSMD